MRFNPPWTAVAANPPCPPDCWVCAVQDRRAPATPLGVALVRAGLDRLARLQRCTHTANGDATRPWPLSAWWEEALG